MRFVDNRPYFPVLMVDPTNMASIVEIANAIVSRSRTNNCVTAACGNYQNGGNSNGKSITLNGNVTVTAITGGLTNALFKLDLTPTTTAMSSSILVRIFGAEGFIDRDLETSTFARLCDRKGTLHDNLELVGRFGNGRVETWVPNMRPACIRDLENVGLAVEVARQMARLHYGVGADASSSALGLRSGNCKLLSPTIWKVIDSWIDELSESLSDEKFRHDVMLMEVFQRAIMGPQDDPHYFVPLDHNGIIVYLSAELKWLKSRVETRFPNAPKAFCHNDINAGNILLDASIDGADGKKTQYNKHTVCIIDYEYSATNYVMFDVANFMCEHCGGNDNGMPNYDLIPSVDRQVTFLQEYIRERNVILSTQSSINDDEVAHLLAQVEVFQMASGLFWGVWGLLQATGEVIDGTFCVENALSRLEGDVDPTIFDYLRYGKNRLARYRYCKGLLCTSD